ncbi:transposase, Mutator family protein [Rickettsia hoogstraalii str. RCCE3]|nr:transposase, Mutator family protein [Rickettsia hoogstraalii str. RCCE3]
MKNRGVKDILIACSDNLTGMSDAIAAVYNGTQKLDKKIEKSRYNIS